MDNSSKTRFGVGAVLLCFFAAAIAIVGTSHQGRGQVPLGGVATVSACKLDPNSPACRIEKLQSQITELQQQVGTLQQRVGALQQTMNNNQAKIDSIPMGQGKADGPDDLWTAIGTLQKRVDHLEKK